MDKSEEEILMFEKAEEIQKIVGDRPFSETTEHDYFACKEHRSILEMRPCYRCPGIEGNLCIRRGNLIWLPTQSQLQAMVRENYQKHHKLIYEFSINKTSWAIDSNEKLELAYVMYKKFNKLWNPATKKWEEK